LGQGQGQKEELTASTSAEGAEKNFLLDILFHRMSVIACFHYSSHIILCFVPLEETVLSIGRDIAWLDIIGLVTAVSMLEAALAGRGRTVAHGRMSYWQVAPWLRPILGIVGLGLLGFAVVHFLRMFYGF